jgi:hypothetical protein
VASNGDTTFDMCNYTTIRTFFRSKLKQYCKERPPRLKIAMTLKKDLAEDQASRIKSNPEKGYQPQRRPVLFRHWANAHLAKTRRMHVSGICKKKEENTKRRREERRSGLRPTPEGLSTRCAYAAGAFPAIAHIWTRMRGVRHCAGGNSHVLTPPPSFYSFAGPTRECAPRPSAWLRTARVGLKSATPKTCSI